MYKNIAFNIKFIDIFHTLLGLNVLILMLKMDPLSHTRGQLYTGATNMTPQG